jgi:CubicO group peptidase (beta-lactamase class C family)
VKASEELTSPDAVGIDAAALEGLLTRARREVDDGLLPACQLAVAKDGKLVAFATFGDATDDDRFLMYSSTKTFVASAVWKLLSEGSLRLDQTVAEIVPAFGANGKDRITVEQILHHVAGVPTAMLGFYDWDDREERHRQFASWTLEWEPGSRYSYHSLSSSWVQAELVETITGRDYRAYITEELVRPLGLERFTLGVPEAQQTDVQDPVLRGEPVTAEELNAAWGLSEVPAGWLSQAMLLVLNDPRVLAVGIPGGGGVSTATDVAMFLQHVHANTGELWDPDVIVAARSNISTFPDDLGVPTARGLGIQVNGDGETGGWAWWYGFGKGNSPRAFGHDGAGGQIAWINPDTGLSFCYLTNGLDENILRQKRRILAIGSRAAALVPNSAGG